MATKRILFTGGTGFVGRNVLPILRERFEVVAPRRAELNLLDDEAVARFVREGGFDVVLHSANTNPFKNPLDTDERFFADSMRAYYNLRRNSQYFGKMFFMGSGAEYDKSREIRMVTEEQFGERLPKEDYGFAKYVMTEDARRSENIYNLRIFGCYGPTDAKTKFIRDSIDCCLENRAITIRQDCMFDFLYVTDYGRIMALFADNPAPRHHDYNICFGKPMSLSAIAAIVARQMGNLRPIEIAKPGWNREYTASNARFLAEYPDFRFTSYEEGIARQIAWQKGITEQ